jgi:L-ascorbate metabolism protein UlaG (beta-lactamase superfamily)
MKLTKYEHACLLLELNGKKAIIDPGVYSKSLGTPSDVVAVVITHEHPDHFNNDTVKSIVASNPDVQIIADESLADKFEGLNFHAVSPGLGIESGPFHFEFFGGEHALIHPSIPIIPNLGVMVNDTLYYPGDSYSLPHKMVPVLALPTDAPWLKLRETVDFLSDVKPEWAFSTHDVFASDEGHDLIDRMLGGFAQKVGSEYRRLEIGKSVDISII